MLATVNIETYPRQQSTKQADEQHAMNVAAGEEELFGNFPHNNHMSPDGLDSLLAPLEFDGDGSDDSICTHDVHS